MTQQSFLREILARIARAGRSRTQAVEDTAASLISLCHSLLPIHPGADLSLRGTENSWGVMVNYLYDGETIEQNHQAYASDHDVSASPRVTALSNG